MNKMAIFVEGQTEMIFVEELLKRIAGQKRLRIEKRRARGGATVRHTCKLIEAVVKDDRQEFFVLIVDCGSDTQVASEIRDQYDSLVKAGYQAILGIRDVYPFKRSQLPELERRLYYRIKTKPIQPVIILAIMEIEAWFLAEHTHLARMSSALTTTIIRSWFGFDPEHDDMQQRDQAAEDLMLVYWLGGTSYRKDRGTVQATVSVLDYARLYLELPDSYPGLKTLVTSIDHFLE